MNLIKFTVQPFYFCFTVGGLVRWFLATPGSVLKKIFLMVLRESYWTRGCKVSFLPAISPAPHFETNIKVKSLCFILKINAKL